MVWTILERYQQFLAPRVEDPPVARVVQVVVLRWTDSYAIFTTEGDAINTETTRAGYQDHGSITRAVLFKRKQTAVERRTGKEWRRAYAEQMDIPAIWNGIRNDREIESIVRCALTQNLCGACPDCILYGFAAQEEAKGSIPSRVWIDSAFTIGPADDAVRLFTLNAVDEITHQTGTALAEQEHLQPGIVFPAVETLMNVSAEELVYVLANILRTRRYGAQTSRTGVVQNRILGVFFGDTEKFTNLDLCRRLYDRLSDDGRDWNQLLPEDVQTIWPEVMHEVLKSYDGVLKPMEEWPEFRKQLSALMSDEAQVVALLRRLEQQAAEYARRKTG